MNERKLFVDNIYRFFSFIKRIYSVVIIFDKHESCQGHRHNWV